MTNITCHAAHTYIGASSLKKMFLLNDPNQGYAAVMPSDQGPNSVTKTANTSHVVIITQKPYTQVN